MMKRLLLIITMLIFPLCSYAADISIEVDAGKTPINALEGSVILPEGVRLESIYTGESSILFWVEPPRYEVSSRTIHFAGTTPGGFYGRRVVLTLRGEFDSEQVAEIGFQGVKAMLNDGEATLAKVTMNARLTDDTLYFSMPEPIYVEYGRSEYINNGRPFVSFVTQDKGSGIDKYEVAEKLFGIPNEGDWQIAHSPYLVQDRMLVKKVYIRAVNKAGNERMAVLALPNRAKSVWFIAIMLIVLCAIYIQRSRRQVL